MRSRISHRVILSAFDVTLEHIENIRRTAALEKTLIEKKLDYHRVLGTYKGIEELSFMVYSSPSEFLTELGKFFKQESILEISSEGGGYLNMLESGTEIFIGDMKVFREPPKGDHSYVFDLGVWFTFENRFTNEEIEATKEAQGA